MSFKISLKNNPTSPLDNNGQESLLDTLRRAGIEVPTSCENGVCATCKGKILKGSVSYPDIEPSGLMPDEEAQGEALFCCAHPQSDCLIDHPELLLPGESPARFFRINLNKIWEITPYVMGIELNIEGTVPFKFLPGQYLELIIGSHRYPFSITNTYQPQNNCLTLHRIHQDPSTENKFISDIKSAERLMIYGPKGRAYLRKDWPGDFIFIAGGGGITPMISMIPEILEHLASQKSNQAIYLYWGVKNIDLLYEKKLFENLSNQYANFHFIPVLSEPDLNPENNIQQGFVHECFLKDFLKFNNPIIYTAGPPLMVQKIKEGLLNLNFPMERLLGDGV